MKVLYALFKEPGVAETALRALKSSGLTEDECRVFVHKDRPSPALRTSESDTRHGLFIGLMAGALGGALRQQQTNRRAPEGDDEERRGRRRGGPSGFI